MTYLKCALAGAAAAFAAVLAWSVAWLLVLLVPMWFHQGSGGLGAISVSSDSMLIVALAGFALGFWLMLRRQRRRALRRT
jgi:hypothetical protein